MQQQILRGQQLQGERGLSPSLQPDLQKLEATLSTMGHTIEAQEHNLQVPGHHPPTVCHLCVRARALASRFVYLYQQVTLDAWQEFEDQRRGVVDFVNKACPILDREPIFSSTESLSTELEQSRVSL